MAKHIMKIAVTKKIQKNIREIKSVIESNKMTLIIIILFTVWEAAIAAIPFEYYWNIDFFVDMVRRTLIYLIIPSLFIETYFLESKVKNLCGYIIAFVFSGMMAACGDLYILSGVEIFPCGILLILFAAIIYKNFKKAKLSIKEYMIKILHNIVKSIVILSILEVCAAYVDSFMAEQFLRKYYFEYNIQIHGQILVLDWIYLGPVGVLVTGLYLGPKMILAIRNMDINYKNDETV